MSKTLVVTLFILALVAPVPVVGENHPLLEAKIDSLKKLIPYRLEKDNVPGLSMVLVSGGKVLWSGSFSRTGRLFGSIIRPQTVYSAASLGKPVTAFITLKFYNERGLSLDTPIYEIYPSDWLPDTPEHRSITTRQLLNHTSGLSNFLRDEKRQLKFRPGEKFAYSGVGYMYLQHVLTGLSGKSWDELAVHYVFGPLNMPRTFFGQPSVGWLDDARGHIGLFRALAPFYIVFTPLFLSLLIVSTIAAKLRKRKWNRLFFWTAALLSTIGTIWFLKIKAGGFTVAAYFAFSAFVYTLLCGFLSFLLHTLMPQRFLPFQTNPVFKTVLFVLVFSAGLLLFKGYQIPVANFHPPEGNAAASLRTSTEEMGNFVVTLMHPASQDSAFVSTMIHPQAKAGEHESWGLGFAILHLGNGDKIWHWGSNPGSKGILVMDLENDLGLVVLANGSNAKGLVLDIAKLFFGGDAEWGV